jgi:hypothetical protein
MFTAEQFRAKAAEYGELLKKTDVATEIREFQRSKGSFDLLAQNEDWLTANFDKTVHSQDELKYDFAEKHAAPKTLSGPQTLAGPKTLAATEEHILRSLGAAVIMRWNTIPTKLQRELFDIAGLLGDLLQTAELRGQIARFLHDHKDDETASC